jgi:hypothetical protein
VIQVQVGAGGLGDDDLRRGRSMSS